MFIVFEGIDGAGCGAQRKAVSKSLSQKGIKVETLKYPWPDDPIGRAIYAFLKEGKNYPASVQFLLFSLQFIADHQKISQLSSQCEVLIADRYFSSTLAYQTIQGMDLNKALEFAKQFDIMRPDLILYLHTPPQIALQRKQKEEGKQSLDRHEQDASLQIKLTKQYDYLAQNNIFAPWETVDNTQNLDVVTTTLVSKIEDMIKIRDKQKAL